MQMASRASFGEDFGPKILLNCDPDGLGAQPLHLRPLLLNKGLQAGEVGQGVDIRDLDNPQPRLGAHDSEKR